MISITPHQCKMALLPPPTLLIDQQGIHFSESATMRLVLTHGALFRINIDNDVLYYEQTSSKDFFSITNITDSGNAMCAIPGLFEFLELKNPTTYAIGDFVKSMRKLTKIETQAAPLDGPTGNSGHSCDPGMADGMHDDTTDDGGIIHIIIPDEYPSLYVANETIDLDDAFAPLPDIYAEPTTTAAPEAEATQNPAPKKKRGPKPGFKKAKASQKA